MVRTDIEPATELDNRRTMSESVLFLLILFENHPPARVGRSRCWRKPRARQIRWGQQFSYGAAKAHVQLQGHRRQRFSYRPTEPMFNYRAAGGSGSHTGRQSQRSTTGPLGTAVLIQADRANVQLQGRWGQRFNYRPPKPTFNYRAFGQGGFVLADRFLNIPRYFLPCHTPAVT